MNDSSRPRPTGLLVVAVLSAVVTLLLAMRLPNGIREFQKMFASLGITPTAAATMVMEAPDAWWLLAMASVAVCIWVAVKSRPNPAELKRMKFAVCTVIGVTVLGYAFTAYAIYLPISRLGAVV